MSTNDNNCIETACYNVMNPICTGLADQCGANCEENCAQVRVPMPVQIAHALVADRGQPRLFLELCLMEWYRLSELYY
ncbi:MAG: hypothetical protein ACXADW_06665 [Candidatus Hodarchaeales archaeon]